MSENDNEQPIKLKKKCLVNLKLVIFEEKK